MASEFRPAAFEGYATESVPQAAAGSAGKNGVLEATFAADSTGQTRLVRDYAKVPFHVTGDLSHDEELPQLASLFVQSPTGGIAQGDRHRIQVDVEPDAQAHVTTQSATQVLGMERNYGRSDVSLTVDDGGYLEFLPEPVILFPDSRLLQRVELNLGSNATLVFGETVVPGRLARGEAFDYDRYYSRVAAEAGADGGDIDADGGRLFEDAVHLANEDDVQRPGLFGEHRVLGSLYVVGTGFDADETETLSERIHERIADGVEGNVHEDDALHDEYRDHEAAGTLERVVVDATTRRRSRFRTTTERGTDIGVVDASEGLRPGDVLAVDDEDRLFVVEFEREEAVVVDLPAAEAGAETLAAAVAFGHLVGNKHWDLAVDDGRVYVRVGADGPRVADELDAHLLDGATLHHERVDPTLFDASGGGHGHGHGHGHGSGSGEHGRAHRHDHGGGHSHGHGESDSRPLTRPTEDGRE